MQPRGCARVSVTELLPTGAKRAVVTTRQPATCTVREDRDDEDRQQQVQHVEGAVEAAAEGGHDGDRDEGEDEHEAVAHDRERPAPDDLGAAEVLRGAGCGTGPSCLELAARVARLWPYAAGLLQRWGRRPCSIMAAWAVATLPTQVADRAVLVVGVAEEVLTEGCPRERAGSRIVGRLAVRVVKPLGQHEAGVPMRRARPVLPATQSIFAHRPRLAEAGGRPELDLVLAGRSTSPASGGSRAASPTPCRACRRADCAWSRVAAPVPRAGCTAAWHGRDGWDGCGAAGTGIGGAGGTVARQGCALARQPRCQQGRGACLLCEAQPPRVDDIVRRLELGAGVDGHEVLEGRGHEEHRDDGERRRPEQQIARGGAFEAGQREAHDGGEARRGELGGGEEADEREVHVEGEHVDLMLRVLTGAALRRVVKPWRLVDAVVRLAVPREAVAATVQGWRGVLGVVYVVRRPVSLL
eukprot:scaffold7257_cov65-Phaeocystis_antarctica.AAC.4